MQISKLTSNSRVIFNITSNLARRMSSMEADDVLFKDFGNKGVITLNRPKALNALNLSMVSKLYPKLSSWQSEKSLVIIKGAGDKAFCAGGDVKSIALEGRNLGLVFFKHEYTTNGLIGSYKIPYVAFIDGIVMGGGVGLSVHGRYRVATERSVFAMPETQIGLFPDVGGSYFLPRLSGKLGLFLALTGYRLKGADLFRAGIATHYVNSTSLPDLEKDLLNNDVGAIEVTLKKYQINEKTDFCLDSHMEVINKCFAADSMEQIVENLSKDGSDFSRDILLLLNKMSPTSLKITLKQLNLGKTMNLYDCLKMEYRMAVGCVSNKDFYEGVRALLIDRDQKPKWDPSELSQVTPDIVDKYFVTLPEDQELKHKL